MNFRNYDANHFIYKFYTLSSVFYALSKATNRCFLVFLKNPKPNRDLRLFLLFLASLNQKPLKLFKVFVFVSRLWSLSYVFDCSLNTTFGSQKIFAFLLIAHTIVLTLDHKHLCYSLQRNDSLFLSLWLVYTMISIDEGQIRIHWLFCA